MSVLLIPGLPLLCVRWNYTKLHFTITPKERYTVSGGVWKSCMKLSFRICFEEWWVVFVLISLPVVLLLGLTLRVGLMWVLFREVTLMSLNRWMPLWVRNCP